MQKLTKRLIGHISVDSGSIMIVDPCYLDEWQPGTHYEAAGNVINKSPHRGGRILVSGVGGFGIVSQTYDGDGMFPVYGHYDKDKLPIRITIEFTRN